MTAMRIAVLGAGSIGSLFALRLAQSGQDVTLVVRNDIRRAHLERDGLRGRARLTGRTTSAAITVVPELRETYDLVIVAVQRPQIESVIPVLSGNDSRTVMFMFNCASGADQWTERIGADRLVWGFPAALADMRDQVVEYAVVPRALRFLQITTIGGLDPRTAPAVGAIRDVFDRAGIPTVVHEDIDAWLKTHAAYMAPIMAMGYAPARSGIGPRFTAAQAHSLAVAMQEAFAAVRGGGIDLTPRNMRVFDRLPTAALARLLWVAFCSPIAKRSLSSHSGAAPGEVAMLLDELQTLAASAGTSATALRELAATVPVD